MTSHLNYKLSYKFQEKDERDHTYTTELNVIPQFKLETTKITRNGKLLLKTSKATPNNYTVTNLPSIIDQGELGACVTNAFFYCVNKQTNKTVNLSRLFLYALCRCVDYTPLNQDDGTTIRTACKSINQYGVCKENIYPYVTSKYMNLPPLNVFNSSKKFKKFIYTFINQDLASIKNCLYTNNTPIIFGFMVYSSFMTIDVANTGVVPQPNTSNETLEGGHCMCIVGYNDTTQQFKCANSWGTSWGQSGYCYLPYSYILDSNLASDFCFTQFVY
jgi:C1A family cysteine protease